MEKLVSYLTISLLAFCFHTEDAFARKSGNKNRKSNLHRVNKYDDESRAKRKMKQNEDTHADDDSANGDETEDNDDDEMEKEGPWRVTVPSHYQKRGYSLRIGSKWQSLNTPEIMLYPKELPTHVSLIDSFGRVEERKRTSINQHLLTGFRPRRFRVSTYIGGGSLKGEFAQDVGLDHSQTHLGIDTLYQPGAFGMILGVESLNSASDASYKLHSNFLKLGGALETGAFYSGPSYRWHQLISGGLSLGVINIRKDPSTDTSKKKDDKGDDSTLAEGSIFGTFASFDSIYMFKNWWWGGRLSFNLLQAKATIPEDGPANSDNPLLDDTESGAITGNILSGGIALIGSFTW